jgi:penicillin-binding protein 1C
VLNSEDRYFFYHPGINPWAVFKAAFVNARRGRVVLGGSTITQQLAKHLIQEKEGTLLSRNFKSKLRATILAVGLEIIHSKKWILERYLNTVYFGNRAYGIAAAANVYFAKDTDRLDDSEIDILVRAIKRPSNMLVIPKKHDDAIFVGRHFVEWGAGKKPSQKIVKTTLDVELQRQLEKNLLGLLRDRVIDDPLVNAAAVVIEVATGDVVAMVGSRGYDDEIVDGQVNVAVALRQPGSTLKPFTYFTAFTRGFSPDSLVPDVPSNFSFGGAQEGYMPQNFDRRFRGFVTIREALANSYNVPSVAVLNRIGLSYYHEILRRFGITSLTKPPQHYGLSVTLGSGEVSLLELTNAYAALARGGRSLPYRIFRDAAVEAPRKIIGGATRHASEITRILMDPKFRLKTFGYNESLEIQGRDVAVKTGTSYDLHDNWTIGYTPSYAVGIWVGHSDGSPLRETTGATGAAPLWHAAMEILLRETPEEKFILMPPLIKKQGEQEEFHEALRDDKKWQILKPLAGTRYQLHSYMPKQHQKILAEVQIEAKLPERLDWFLDGDLIESTLIAEQIQKHRIWLSPEPGLHLLRVQSSGESRQVSYYVDDFGE